MAGRVENGSGRGGGGAAAAAGGAGYNKKILASIRDATCASDEDIQFMLTECDGDVNEAVSRLLDNPFEQVHVKKDRRAQQPRKDGPGAPPQVRRDGPPGQRVVEVKRGGFSGSDRGGRTGRGGRGERGDRVDRPGSGGRGGGAPQKPAAGAAPKPAHQAAPVPQAAPAPAKPADVLPAAAAQVPQPPPIRPTAGGAGPTSFSAMLRVGITPVNVPAPAPVAIPPPAPASTTTAAAPAPAPAASHAPLSAPTATTSAPMSFAEKLAQAQVQAAAAPAGPAATVKPEAASMPVMPTPLTSAYQQASAADKPSATEAPTSAWGAPGVKTSSVQNAGLAGLLSGQAEEENKSMLQGMTAGAASAADSLSLQFGQFGMGGAGMGDFGAGFGAGFGEELGGTDEPIPPPAPVAVKAPEPEVVEDNSNAYSAPESASSYQSAQAYSYGQPPSAAITSLGQAPKAPEAPSVPASTAASVSSALPTPYYGHPNTFHYGMSQDTSYQHYGQASQRPQAEEPKYGGMPTAGQREEGPTSSSAAAGSAPLAAAAPVQQPVLPQMPAGFPNHGMPPGMAQYGYMHPQYPNMPFANMYMYNPYTHYPAAGAYPPQAGSTNFPPSVGSGGYPGQAPSGGAMNMKYSYPYTQSSHTPPASGLAPGGYGGYGSNPSAYGGDDSSTGGGYSKDSKDSLYGAAGGQQHQMQRDGPYAGYSMPGQGYQQQGFNASAQGQYGNSAYAQYMTAPYALGGQNMLPPHSSAAGSGQSNYKLQ